MDLLTSLRRNALIDEDAAELARERLAGGASFDDALFAALHDNADPAAPMNTAGNPAEEKVLRHLAEQFGLPYAEPDKANPPRELLSRFPARVLLTRRLLPLEQDAADGSVVIATHRVLDSTGLDELRVATGLDVRPALAPAHEIERATKRLLGVGADTLQSMGADDDELKIVEDDSEDLDITNVAAAAQDASIIRFVNQIMAEALEARATDVHVEPFEHQLRIRYRIDGVLVEAPVPPKVRKYHAAIVSRLKILSHLDIAEKRLPQDGRIRLRVAGREIDLRVSVIPMIHGEAVVLRILDRGETMFGLEHLGMSERDNSVWTKILDLPHGIILVTGPTGSGKTTTLYAALSKINNADLKIVTIEDPVEYQLKGINQIQVNTKAGLTFGAGLRAILRHDPDVVLIGEIRDKETAEIAVQASLTGHLVFSTLHTNDAPGAATRLVDMGVEPYLVASSVELVAAQRLVRLICKHCKTEMPRDEYRRIADELGEEVPPKLFRGVGCRHCQGTGYRGRQGVFEMMPVTDEIRSLVISRASSRDIRKVAIRQGMKSLREDGWRLIGEGRTTVEEVLRMTKDEEIAVGMDAAGAAMV
jgi:general secretion pathway protein E/type IV pilus assembly protein PilB